MFVLVHFVLRKQQLVHFMRGCFCFSLGFPKMQLLELCGPGLHVGSSLFHPSLQFFVPVNFKKRTWRKLPSVLELERDQ